MSVVIDTNLNEDLIKEGIARELTSKIQTMRKDAGFEVVDHIVVGYEGEGKAIDVLVSDKTIASGVLAESVENKLDGYTQEWDINGETIKLSVKKI
jgi:isoleucyl-tRNA synthetase